MLVWFKEISSSLTFLNDWHLIFLTKLGLCIGSLGPYFLLLAATCYGSIDCNLFVFEGVQANPHDIFCRIIWTARDFYMAQSMITLDKS